jgi:hypothetical protein
VLLGSSPIAAPRLLHKHARSEDPSLRRHYPVSTVLRSSPTPVWPAALATALGPTRPRQVSPGNAHCLYQRAVPTTPADQNGCTYRLLPHSARPSPLPSRVGIRIATFEACSGFTRYGPLARSAAQRRPLSQGSGPLSHPNKPLVRYSIKPVHYRGGIFLHWQHAPTGRTGQRRPARLM